MASGGVEYKCQISNLKSQKFINSLGKGVKKMRGKKLLIIAGILGLGLFLFVAGTNFAMAATAQDLQPTASAKTFVYNNDVIWNGNLTATKSLTVGTKKNKGKLYVKGTISNPNKKKPVVVKDDLKVTGDLEVKGEIKGAGIIKNENIGLGAITGDKIANNTITGSNISQSADLKVDSITSEWGSIKGWAYVNYDGSLIKGYNATSSELSDVVYYVYFNFDTSERIALATVFEDPLVRAVNILAIGENYVTVRIENDTPMKFVLVVF